MGSSNYRRSYVLACAMALIGAATSEAMTVREALAHFETGATTPARCAADAKIGTRKEVSRFQILPSLWRKYAEEADYRNPQTAWEVAERILAERQTWFRTATGRDWDGVDLYIMWNAPGAYERANFDRRKVSRVVLERAERFSNLLIGSEDRDRVLVRGESSP